MTKGSKLYMMKRSSVSFTSNLSELNECSDYENHSRDAAVEHPGSLRRSKSYCDAKFKRRRRVSPPSYYDIPLRETESENGEIGMDLVLLENSTGKSKTLCLMKPPHSCAKLNSLNSNFGLLNLESCNSSNDDDDSSVQDSICD